MFQFNVNPSLSAFTAGSANRGSEITTIFHPFPQRYEAECTPRLPSLIKQMCFSVLPAGRSPDSLRLYPTATRAKGKKNVPGVTTGDPGLHLETPLRQRQFITYASPPSASSQTGRWMAHLILSSSPIHRQQKGHERENRSDMLSTRRNISGGRKEKIKGEDRGGGGRTGVELATRKHVLARK